MLTRGTDLVVGDLVAHAGEWFEVVRPEAGVARLRCFSYVDIALELSREYRRATEAERRRWLVRQAELANNEGFPV